MTSTAARDWSTGVTVVAAFVVAVIAFCSFIPDLRNSLLDWDDVGYVVDNDLVRNLNAETILRSFTETRNYYWAPLTWISLAIDHKLWGLNPFGYHLTNNILHAVNAVLFFFIGIRILSSDNREAGVPAGSYVLMAAVAATVWSIHPLRVESVAWIAERKDVLSTLFGLAAILVYLQHAAEQRLRPAGFYSCWRYWCAAGLYLVSMMTKAGLMTLPALLLLLDWYPLRRHGETGWRKLLVEKLPLAMIAAAVSVITFRAMSYSSVSLNEITPVARVLTAFKSLFSYLWLTLLPTAISPVYFHPTKVVMDSGAMTAMAAVAALTALSLAQIGKRPWICASWGFMVIAVFPVLGLAQSGPTAEAARFTYVATMPLYLLLAAGYGQVWRLAAGRGGPWKLFLTTVPVLLSAILIALTVRDIGHWKNDITLWSRVIELQPKRFGKAYYQRALFFIQAGDYRSALPDLNEALIIAQGKQYKDIHEIYALRARVRWMLMDGPGAVEDYTEAVNRTDLMHGVVYLQERAAIYQALGDSDRANQDLDLVRQRSQWK